MWRRIFEWKFWPSGPEVSFKYPRPDLLCINLAPPISPWIPRRKGGQILGRLLSPWMAPPFRLGFQRERGGRSWAPHFYPWLTFPRQFSTLWQQNGLILYMSPLIHIENQRKILIAKINLPLQITSQIKIEKSCLGSKFLGSKLARRRTRITL